MVAAALVIQVITGVLLGMHYIPSTEYAFSSIEHIMRDVPNGFFLRYCHANGASLFFFLVYLHAARSIWHGSYGYPRMIT